MRVAGPSKILPMGSDLCEFDFNPSTHRLTLSVTDRKDFYHQFRVPHVRAVSNTLGPALPRSLLVDLNAHADWIERRSKVFSRLEDGDGLELFGRFPKPPRRLPDHLFASFGSILQGDHGGVEYACDSHQGLLQDWGLLNYHSRIAANRPFRGIGLMEGLVIDDYFALSASPLGSTETTPDQAAFDTAQKAYSAHALLGSPTKDIRGESQGKVIGASVNASKRALDFGMCLVGAPSSKRLALSWISLQVSTLTHTSDVLHLCLLGGWISCLGFRRPMMSLLNESFRLVDASKIDPLHPKLVPLPRAVACELVLLSVLCCFAVSDICAPFHERVFSTDASIQKGAICSAPVNVDFARVLWRSSRSKGAYHRLLTPSEALAKNLGVHEELPAQIEPSVDRPLAFHYEFLEVFAGAHVISTAASARGLVVGPPIDISLCREYDMSFVHVLQWISAMISDGRLMSFAVEPPCTTFSIMRKPPLRSRLCPFGFSARDVKTATGNLLAARALQLMHIGFLNQVTGLLETPFSSLLKHLPAFKNLVCHSEVQQCRTDSCMLGSIHQKSFRFVGVHADLDPLRVKCDRQHKHVQIAGAYTKKSATYTPLLADRFAEVVQQGVLKKRAHLAALDSLPTKGLESQLVNSVALHGDWSVDSSWTFSRFCHINILEFSVLERLATKLASRAIPSRVTCLCDSHVCSAASAKGRTSSAGLGPVVRRYCAICVACGLYFSVPYVPTRLNVSDDPTRDVPLRSSSGCFSIFDWPVDSLYDLAALPKLRRWASNWVRLVISVLGSRVLALTDRSVYRHAYPNCGCLFESPSQHHMDFDSTLGFPGEGPIFPLSLGLALFTSTAQGALCCTVGFRCSVSPGRVVFAMAFLHEATSMMPRNPADAARQARRNTQPLALGRPVLPVTSFNRENLFAAFESWCTGTGIDFESLLENSLQQAEGINACLASYGRMLYYAGRPYGHFAETINAVVSRKAILRRHLQPAWDVAYAWMRNEPPVHHVACPWQVVLALISSALIWGWTREAGVIALCFAGILRAGEGLNALRRDLLLPADSLGMNDFALLALEESKTRFSVARHQCAKIDSADMLRVLRLAFEHLLPTEKLWPWSNQTFRNRFRTLLASLGLPTSNVNGVKPLEVGSLRPGGATWLLQATENSELVRRRGRWTTTKVLEIYLQETACIRFWTSLDESQRSNILTVGQSFLAVLEKAELLKVSNVPPNVWFKIFSWSWCAWKQWVCGAGNGGFFSEGKNCLEMLVPTNTQDGKGADCEFLTHP